jgi:hypothetical protein
MSATAQMPPGMPPPMYPPPEPERRLVVVHDNGLRQIMGVTRRLDQFRQHGALVLNRVTPRAVYYRTLPRVGTPVAPPLNAEEPLL